MYICIYQSKNLTVFQKFRWRYILIIFISKFIRTSTYNVDFHLFIVPDSKFQKNVNYQNLFPEWKMLFLSKLIAFQKYIQLLCKCKL